MAEKDTTIEIEDEGTVTVDVTDNPDLAEDEVVPQPKPVAAAPKPAKTAAVDEAAAALRRQQKLPKTSATPGLRPNRRRKTSAMPVSLAEEARRVKRRKPKPSVRRAGK